MNGFVETPVKNSSMYDREYSRTAPLPLPSVIFYYNENLNIVGVERNLSFTIGITTTSATITSKLVSFDKGCSIQYDSIGRKIYGNYEDYGYKYKGYNIYTIIYRVANGIYEFAFPDIGIPGNQFSPFKEVPDISVNLLMNPFLFNSMNIGKTYSNPLTTITIYYKNAKILGFSTSFDMVGKVTNDSKTIDLTQGLSFKFFNERCKVYGNYNDYKYKFKAPNPPSIKTIHYKHGSKSIPNTYPPQFIFMQYGLEFADIVFNIIAAPNKHDYAIEYPRTDQKYVKFNTIINYNFSPRYASSSKTYPSNLSKITFYYYKKGSNVYLNESIYVYDKTSSGFKPTPPQKPIIRPTPMPQVIITPKPKPTPPQIILPVTTTDLVLMGFETEYEIIGNVSDIAKTAILQDGISSASVTGTYGSINEYDRKVYQAKINIIDYNIHADGELSVNFPELIGML